MGYQEPLYYLGPYYGRDRHFPFGVIMGSRGCVYKCGFCSNPGHRRVHPASYVFAQIIELNNRYGIRLFAFFDSLFTTSSPSEQKRIEALCKMILCCGLDIRYLIEIRADVILQLPERLLSLMIRSGCVEFNLGLEKGSDRMLQKMTKGMSIQDHFEAVEKLRRVAKRAKREVFVNGSFILGGPGETKEDVRDTIIHSLALDLDEVTLYSMLIYPGTEVYAEARRKGILKPGLVSYMDAKEFPLYSTDALPKSYLLEIGDSCERVFDSLREVKKTMQEIEGQFLPEEERYPLSFPIRRTRNLDKKIKGCIHEALNYLKNHPNEGLSKNGVIAAPIVVQVQKVEKAVALLERQLKQKYPNYDSDYTFGDYYPGFLLSHWKTFLQKFDELFSLVPAII